MIIEGERRTKLLKLVSLANFLDDLPSDKFHMPTWTSPDATPESCGTAGCACGWAATVFHKEGWELQTCSHSRIPYFKGTIIPTINEVPQPVYSFANFFDISIEDAYHVTCNLDDMTSRVCMFDDFTLPNYITEYNLGNAKFITPRLAADRIRKVLTKIDPTLLEEQAPKIEYKPCALAKA